MKLEPKDEIFFNYVKQYYDKHYYTLSIVNLLFMKLENLDRELCSICANGKGLYLYAMYLPIEQNYLM